MSVTTTSLSDSLLSSIPKLDASGLNWAIFSVCFKDMIQSKGFWDILMEQALAHLLSLLV